MLHARVEGPAGAPPLVLLDSLGTTTGMWDPVLPGLVEQFRVVRIDHPGHGQSPPAPAGTAASLAGLAEEVLAVLDGLHLAGSHPDRVHLAGVSLGGMTAMWLAVHRPQRVGRLALICTSAHLPPARDWRDRAAAVRAGGMAAVVDAVVARWVTPGLAARDPEQVAALRGMVLGADPDSYAQCCEAIAAMDLRPDLPRIGAPTLVVAAAQDTATPPEHARRIAAAVPGARLHVLDGAAHIPTVERPAELAGLLREHFRGGATLAGGYATRRAVLGDPHVDRTLAGTTPLTAPFQELLTRYAWGEVWSRDELSRRERSVATLAVLVSLGAERELALHVRAAQNNGLTAEEIVEVIMHSALYAGLPRANAALAVAREVLAGQ